MADANKPPPSDDPAVSVCFTVSIDGDDLGLFNTCEGLGLEVVIEQREEGGNNEWFGRQLPTRIKYSNVKLSRPVYKDSAELTAWISSFANGVKRQTATIIAMTGDREKVVTWNLDGVIPVRWSGSESQSGQPEGGHGDRRACPSWLPAKDGLTPTCTRGSCHDRAHCTRWPRGQESGRRCGEQWGGQVVRSGWRKPS